MTNEQKARATELRVLYPHSLETVAAELGISRSTLHNSMSSDPAFEAKMEDARSNGSQRRATAFSAIAFEKLMSLVEEVGHGDPKERTARSTELRALLDGLGRCCQEFSQRTHQTNVNTSEIKEELDYTAEERQALYDAARAVHAAKVRARSA